jgi:hypothetical protein
MRADLKRDDGIADFRSVGVEHGDGAVRRILGKALIAFIVSRRDCTASAFIASPVVCGRPLGASAWLRYARLTRLVAPVAGIGLFDLLQNLTEVVGFRRLQRGELLV